MHLMMNWDATASYMLVHGCKAIVLIPLSNPLRKPRLTDLSLFFQL